jgi:hypothetical protein
MITILREKALFFKFDNYVRGIGCKIEFILEDINCHGVMSKPECL